MAACCACCPLHISPTHTTTTLLAYEGLLLCEQRLQHGGLLRLLLHLSLLEGHHGLRHGGGVDHGRVGRLNMGGGRPGHHRLRHRGGRPWQSCYLEGSTWMSGLQHAWRVRHGS